MKGAARRRPYGLTVVELRGLTTSSSSYVEEGRRLNDFVVQLQRKERGLGSRGSGELDAADVGGGEVERAELEVGGEFDVGHLVGGVSE